MVNYISRLRSFGMMCIDGVKAMYYVAREESTGAVCQWTVIR